jgi:hypothetical protein
MTSVACCDVAWRNVFLDNKNVYSNLLALYYIAWRGMASVAAWLDLA